MPQLFQVLRCYQCLVFQVHQTKKSNKWQCKMCGEKQSVKRHYALGNAKECRFHVQKLNGLRGEIEDERSSIVNSDIISSDSAEGNIDNNFTQNDKRTKSKWSTYIENEVESAQEVNDPMYLGNNEVCLEIPSKNMKSREIKRKKVVPTNYFQTPYKFECEEISAPSANELIKPVKKSKLNIVFDDDLTNQHKTIPTLKEQAHEKKVVQKSSKWARFVESEDMYEEKDEFPTQDRTTVTSAKTLFQLCDDTDLDEVLTI